CSRLRNQRDSLSSPTRRSSDLRARQAHPTLEEREFRSYRPDRTCCSHLQTHRGKPAPAANPTGRDKADCGSEGDIGSNPAHRWSDRKSTRLNSSHVKISYAVFC